MAFRVVWWVIIVHTRAHTRTHTHTHNINKHKLAYTNTQMHISHTQYEQTHTDTYNYTQKHTHAIYAVTQLLVRKLLYIYTHRTCKHIRLMQTVNHVKAFFLAHHS